MAIQAVGIAALAAVEAAEVLRAAGEISLGGGAQYLRDGQPVGVVAQAGQALARLACRRYGSNPDQYPSDTALNYERACRPYLEDIGEGSGPSLQLPFRGGQCDAVYTINYTLNSLNAEATTGFLQARGPIRGIVRVPLNATTDNVFLQANGVNISGSPNCRAVANTGASNYFLGSAPNSGGSVSTINSVTPCGLDNCGNPPPEVIQPEPPPITLPPIVPIIIAPELDIDASVEVNIDGSINIDIGTGDITIDPFGDDGDGGDPGGGGPDDSPPNPEPGPELPGGNGGFGGDDLFGEPPAGRRWVGCCITITNRPTSQPPIPGSTPEDVYASVVGNIRLVYDATGVRQTDTPIRIQAKKVCVWEAVRKLNPVGVSVDLQPGFGYSYRPYSVPLDA